MRKRNDNSKIPQSTATQRGELRTARFSDLRDVARREARPIGYAGTLRVAQQQAALLLTGHGAVAPVPIEIISGLRQLRVEFVDDQHLPSASFWDVLTRRWVIQVSSSLELAQRRVAIAREFKRILDHPDATIGVDEFVEHLLVPGALLHEAIEAGHTTPTMLSEYFKVPEPVITQRLRGSGLGPGIHARAHLDTQALADRPQMNMEGAAQESEPQFPTGVLFLSIETPSAADKAAGSEEPIAIGIQRDIGHRLAVDRGIGIVKEFVEVGIPAASLRRRPVLRRALAYLETHPGISYVVVPGPVPPISTRAHAELMVSHLKRLRLRVVLSDQTIATAPELSPEPGVLA
ncbi:hypothetical protein [Nocardia asteroides]|uniref:hypothetical protein n=1 Tax=Nocardia asteroides TaxID=1824 RepID=UPI001E37401F|nr:hypothetical protein [Nocardia asteroides]UGT62880.1 hypothetical protein LTT61_05950 [Nocardia asteroides]